MVRLLLGLTLVASASIGSSARNRTDTVELGLNAPPTMGVVVDLSERNLKVLIDGKPYREFIVAVGAPTHRTPTGTYRLSQVIWNPGWVPPKSGWASEKEPKEPGEPGNPMGRVKILFDSLLYIHGTNATGTLGEPASHGCVRMRNTDAMRLARLVQELGGAPKKRSWYSRVRANRTKSVEVAIPNPPTLEIRE
jgi:murein L,D-transpeptidase YcbB/YkuD